MNVGNSGTKGCDAFSTTLGPIIDLHVSHGYRKRLRDYQMPKIRQPSKWSFYIKEKEKIRPGSGLTDKNCWDYGIEGKFGRDGGVEGLYWERSWRRGGGKASEFTVLLYWTFFHTVFWNLLCESKNHEH